MTGSGPPALPDRTGPGSCVSPAGESLFLGHIGTGDHHPIAVHPDQAQFDPPRVRCGVRIDGVADLDDYPSPRVQRPGSRRIAGDQGEKSGVEPVEYRVQRERPSVSVMARASIRAAGGFIDRTVPRLSISISPTGPNSSSSASSIRADSSFVSRSGSSKPGGYPMGQGRGDVSVRVMARHVGASYLIGQGAASHETPVTG